MTEPPAADRTDDGASLWSIGPEDAPVLVRNAEAVLPYLTIFLGGWPVRFVGRAAEAGLAADIDIVERADGGIGVVLAGAYGYELSFDDDFNAANGLASALIASFVSRRRETVCLHASSVAVGAGADAALAVMLGESLAGKSSTALQMAAAGYRLFGDDRLAVDLSEPPPRGMCLGLMPKVRLPLPPDAGFRFQEFVDGYTEIRDDRAAYLRVWDNDAAVFGETAPLGALVVLDRRDSGGCVLESAARSDIVRTLVANCYAPHIDSDALVPMMSALADRVPGYALRFSSSAEAAAAVAARMSEHRKGTVDG